MMEEKSSTKRVWSREEFILALDLYHRIEFVGRTPSSIGMRLANFANCDPTLKERGVKSLAGAFKLRKPIQDKFECYLWNLIGKVYIEELIGIYKDYNLHISSYLKSHKLDSEYPSLFPRTFESKKLLINDAVAKLNPTFLNCHMVTVYNRKAVNEC